MEYLDRLSGVSIDDMAIPSGIRNYLQKLEEDEFKVMRQSFLDETAGFMGSIFRAGRRS